MAETTGIQWTDHAFNHVLGCSKVAPGCKFCYAEVNRATARVQWGPHGTRSRTADSTWKHPLTWNRKAEKEGVRRRVFCASLADVFEDWQGEIISHDGRVYWTDGSTRTTANAGSYMLEPFRKMTMDDLRRDLFALIDQTPHLDWLLLTKRPENIRRMWPDAWDGPVTDKAPNLNTLRSNVWLGTSISTQADADRSIPELLKCADLCRLLFISAEPLLEEVSFERIPLAGYNLPTLDVLRGGCWTESGFINSSNAPRLSLVIAGGESGPHARPCNLAWLRSIRDQCRAAGVSCFVKQLGSKPVQDDYQAQNQWPHGVYFDGPEDNEPDRPMGIVLRDSKGGAMEEWPEDLRVREMPV